MINFLMLGTNDLSLSSKFYDAILLPLDIIRVLETDRYVGYAKKNDPKNIALYITIPYDKNKATNGNGTMVGLLANSKTKVDQFHQNALNHGAVNEGLPGARHGKDYYCYIRDLDGNKITVFAID